MIKDKILIFGNGQIGNFYKRFFDGKGIESNVTDTDITKKEEVEGRLKFYYWKNQQQEEVDFVVKNDSKIIQLVQVCYDLADPDTKKREVKALLKASKDLKCNNLLVINQDYSGEESLEWFGIKRKIKFIPLWKWLLI